MTTPDISALLRACGFKSDREQAEDALLAAHSAVVRSLEARSRRAQLKNGREAMGKIRTALHLVTLEPSCVTYEPVVKP